MLHAWVPESSAFRTHFLFRVLHARTLIAESADGGGAANSIAVLQADGRWYNLFLIEGGRGETGVHRSRVHMVQGRERERDAQARILPPPSELVRRRVFRRVVAQLRRSSHVGQVRVGGTTLTCTTECPSAGDETP